MTQIGIYGVSREELTLAPEERTYRQYALYDTEDGWSETSDPRFIDLEPDEKTVAAFADQYGSQTTIVAPPDEVPGTIEVVDPPEDVGNVEGW